MVPRRDGEEVIDALVESLRILLPYQVMQEDAHGVHADALGPSQLAVDGDGVIALGLPHFKLIDGGRGQEVCAHGPGLLGIPGIGLGFAPAGRCGGARLGKKTRDACEQQRE